MCHFLPRHTLHPLLPTPLSSPTLLKVLLLASSLTTTTTTPFHPDRNLILKKKECKENKNKQSELNSLHHNNPHNEWRSLLIRDRNEENLTDERNHNRISITELSGITTLEQYFCLYERNWGWEN